MRMHAAAPRSAKHFPAGAAVVLALVVVVVIERAEFFAEMGGQGIGRPIAGFAVLKAGRSL